jgi:NAD(P)H-hydrate repair Nnr-like enzyme with NAD(P)H-hydrate dehydratase domain
VTVKQGIAKRVPPHVDRVGGVGSILAGFMCAYIGWGDYSAHHSIYKVWAFFFVLLICNGIAMLIHARKTEELDKLHGGHRL